MWDGEGEEARWMHMLNGVEVSRVCADWGCQGPGRASQAREAGRAAKCCTKEMHSTVGEFGDPSTFKSISSCYN